MMETADRDEDMTANHKPPRRRRSLIFTYGTLKRGFGNHGLMQDLISTDDAAFLGPHSTVAELPLVCGPHGVPFLLNLPGSGRRIRGELYAVSDRGLARIDELEGITIGHYERLPIQLLAESEIDSGGGGGGEAAMVVEAEAYYAHRSYAAEMWRRKGEVGFGEYTDKEASEYVRRSERPKERTFLEDIRLFCTIPSESQGQNCHQNP